MYKLYLVGLQVVRWKNKATVRAEDIFFIEEETKIINVEQECFVHHSIVSAGKGVELVSDRK